MAPSMAAVVTPAGVLQAVGSGGWNVSPPSAVAPANRVVEIVVDVGWPGCGLIAGSVTLGTTFPSSLTAAAAPVVVYWTTVTVPSAQVTIPVPLVVLLAQPPVPVDTGSWNCSPVASV